MQQNDKGSPLEVFTEAIAYFIAGSFVINVIAPRLFSQDPGNLVNQAVNWLTLAAGGFSILVAFFFVLTAIPCKRMQGLSRFFNRYKHWPLVILFPITLPQIVPVILDSEWSPLSITAWVFLFFILAAIMTVSLRALVKLSLQYLIALGLAFGMSAIIRLFQGADKTEVAVILAVLCVSLIFALLKLLRKRESPNSNQPPTK